MALDRKTCCIVFGIICLCLFGIPIRIDKTERVDENLSLFKNYVAKYNKSYQSNQTEYDNRFDKFQRSLQSIQVLNDDRPSEHSARYGLTKFSDMTREEFVKKHLQPKLHEHIERRKLRQIKKSMRKHQNSVMKKRAVTDSSLPLYVDWREKKVITSVRNQKSCGACWAFSAVQTVETMFALKTGVLQTLSVQEIIDCAQNGNMGCSGGDTCSMLDWLTVNKIKIEPEKEYPLTWQTQTCKLKGSELGVQVADNFTCESYVGRENSLLTKLATHGPVAVAINAINWQNYLGGVIQFHCDGNPAMLNHAVQIVGYDQRPPIPHYIVRNSWGADFGDKGYLYIAIGDNLCGLGTEVAALNVL